MTLRNLRQEWLSNIRGDVLSGIVVALALIPEAIAFSIIAGVDPKVGLYASFCIAVVTAIVGGRPGMISGATGAMALLMVTLVKDHGLQYLMVATMLTGVLQILAGVFKLGMLMRFVSRSVVTGFVNALAILIFMAQLPELIGAPWQVYALVVAAQEAALAETRPGVPYNVPHDAATRVLAQGMLDTGLLDADKVGTLDDVIAGGQYRQFYMHRTGHWLGMDVHDVGEYRTPGTAAPAEGERPWRPLEAGMVLTVEPGIYVRPAPGVPEQYWHIGIRIEDDAIVTPEGCEIITRDVPVAPDEIELVMRSQA